MIEPSWINLVWDSHSSTHNGIEGIPTPIAPVRTLHHMRDAGHLGTLDIEAIKSPRVRQVRPQHPISLRSPRPCSTEHLRSHNSAQTRDGVSITRRAHHSSCNSTGHSVGLPQPVSEEYHLKHNGSIGIDAGTIGFPRSLPPRSRLAWQGRPHWHGPVRRSILIRLWMGHPDQIDPTDLQSIVAVLYVVCGIPCPPRSAR